MEYVALDGYVVHATTDLAVGIAKARSPFGSEHLEWIPRSLCEDGRSLSKGDEDISVATFKADELGLDY